MEARDRRFTDFLALPAEVTPYERNHVAHLNKVAVACFFAHVPVFMAVAWWHGTGVLTALLLTTFCALGPMLAVRSLPERQAAMVVGFASMCMGGLLVHFGQGPVQIEMHFYFFVLLAMLSTYGNPAVVLTAAGTVTVHHLLVWWFLPASVFNYDASFWVVAVHAVFVVLESVAACYLARNFFDDVIGLEKTVQARTSELNERNADLQRVRDDLEVTLGQSKAVLNAVEQGLVVVDRQGMLTGTSSKRVADWFGSVPAGVAFAEWMGSKNPGFGEWFAIGWEDVVDGFMPMEVILDQLPGRLELDGRTYALEYRPMLRGDMTLDDVDRILIVLSDRTEAIAMETERRKQEEIVHLFQRVNADRQGFMAFFRDGSELVDRLRGGQAGDAETKRIVHTIKGNCGVMGVRSVATVCHVVETAADDESRPIDAQGIEAVAAAWQSFSDRVADFVQLDDDGPLAIDRDDYAAVCAAVSRRLDHDALEDMLARWTWDDVGKRLSGLGEKGADLARRLGKGTVEIEVESDGLRVPPGVLDSFWSAFVHVVRNAADHGIEAPEDRVAAGKPEQGRLTLRCFTSADSLCIESRDDGAGIAWDKLKDKVAGLGLQAESEHALVDALFMDGITTRDFATETSGRGVGMAAVKQAVEALGGRIEVESEMGQGTVFRHHFPLDVVFATPAEGPLVAQA